VKTLGNAARAERVDVKTGSALGNLVVVFGEINDDDCVVLLASDVLRPGICR
jgi:hypothetical protein